MLTDYTDYDTIRALLGVGRREITDATLALPIYNDRFTLALEGIDGGTGAASTQYSTIKAKTAATRTANEARYFMLVNMWAAYVVAQELLATVPMFAPQRISDGKTLVERFADPFAAQREGVASGYVDLLNRIKTLLLVLDAAAQVTAPVARIFISSTGVSPDPITGV